MWRFFKDFLRIFVFFSVFILHLNCQTSPKFLSKKKRFRILSRHKAPIDFSHNSPPEKALYIKQKRIMIKKKTPFISGSLVNIDTNQNYLFLTVRPYHLGQMIDVQLVYKSSRQSTPSKKNSSTPSKKNSSAPGEKDPEIDKLWQQFPDLIPENKTNLPLKKYILMKVTDIYFNGDLLLAYEQNSESSLGFHRLKVTALLSQDKQKIKTPVTTEILRQIKFFQDNKQNGYIYRESPDWKDSYSLRISNYQESESRFAKKFQEQRKRFNKLKIIFNNKLKKFSIKKMKFKQLEEKSLSERKKNAATLKHYQLEIKKLRDQLPATAKQKTSQEGG